MQQREIRLPVTIQEKMYVHFFQYFFNQKPMQILNLYLTCYLKTTTTTTTTTTTKTKTKTKQTKKPKKQHRNNISLTSMLDSWTSMTLYIIYNRSQYGSFLLMLFRFQSSYFCPVTITIYFDFYLSDARVHTKCSSIFYDNYHFPAPEDRQFNVQILPILNQMIDGVKQLLLLKSSKLMHDLHEKKIEEIISFDESSMLCHRIICNCLVF